MPDPGQAQQSDSSLVPPAAITKPAGLLSQYGPQAGDHDEVFGPDGTPRSVYAPLIDRLDRLGANQFDRRWARSERMIHENGVAYRPHGGPDDAPRPWWLDPLPLVVPQEEWSGVSEALAQRAKLLELLLQDLYGPQLLVQDGVLPAELLYSHPGYLLPLRREGGAGFRLPFYAADLARAPDGKWWVLADRCEAPSGIGFALENRIVLSRMLSEPFRDFRVRRMAPFFLSLRETLGEIAPSERANPRVAILSQGPGHANYFEDAYLARYLGYTLVEGGDLTVRNRRLWLKTLEGLAPIDVLVRRPNSNLCDPLELGGQSEVGVAGLLQASRDAGVAVANPLGSGLVESPVFMAFMPRLCQKVLGEKLKAPGVATWWCGEASSLEYVLDNLETLVVKPAYRDRARESAITSQLLGTPPDRLRDLIKSNPLAYVAQERVTRSTAPVYRDGGITSARVALRAFAVASDDSFQVLEGALGRTAPSSEPLETSLLVGEGSKDVWVVSDQPVEPVTLLPQEHETIQLVRFGAELPSRVADNSFWLGRHLERADAKTRLLRIVADRLTGEGPASELAELPALLRALAEQGQIEPGYAVEGMRDQLPALEQALPGLALDRQSDGSLGSTVERMFYVASQVRDRLSRDTWRILLGVRDRFGTDRDSADLTDLLNLTDDLIADLSALGGMVIESMTRTQFYRFLDIGRRLERAVQLVDLLTACLVESPPAGRPLLEALLDSSDSLMTYRARYRANLRLAPVLDLLVTDAANPRSLAYQVETLLRHVCKLPNNSASGPNVDPEQKIVLSMAHALRMIDIDTLTESHELGRPDPLAALLSQLARELPALSDAIALKYLVHAGPPRQLFPF